MEKHTAFEKYNPIVNFSFFVVAILFGMIFMHPYFLLISFALAVIFFVSVSGRAAIKLFLSMLPVALLVALLNPLLNTRGEHVLFTYFDRNYTLESVVYGAVFAVILLVISFWFASYSKLITSDKFMYIFGPLAPSLSLVLTMVLRFVPNFSTKAKQIVNARQSIGKGDKRDAPAVIGALSTWGFENGITTADSMKSRGYGSGRRTSFSIFKFTVRDAMLLLVMILLSVIIIYCSVKGGMTATFVPTIEFENNIYTFVGLGAYFLLLILPTIINLKEVLLWQILRSKI